MTGSSKPDGVTEVSTPTNNRRGGPRSSKSKPIRTSTAISNSPPVNGGCWCFGRRRKSVRFAKNSRKNDLLGTASGAAVASRPPTRRQGTRGKGLPPASVERRITFDAPGSVNRQMSRQSFYTAYSSYSKYGELTTNRSSPDTPTTIDTTEATCGCGFKCHIEHDPEIPLIISPNVVPGSRDEMLMLIKPILGRWVTILDRSESLDPQMVILGISKMKRMVMNKLAVPFAATMRGPDVFDTWITTPLGEKHSTCHLDGKILVDQDSDVGEWTSRVAVIDFSTKMFCDGRPFRALRLYRKSDKIGEAEETKAVVPDSQEGRILLYETHLIPKNGEPVRVMRVCRFVGPDMD